MVTKKFKGWLATLPQANVRYVLFVSTLILLGCFIILNQFFISSLETQALEVNEKEARLYAVAIAEQLSKDEINVIFNEIVLKSQVPMVVTDNHNIPISWNNIRLGFWEKHLNLDPVAFDQLGPRERAHILGLVREYDRERHPLPLQADGHNFGYLHYGELPLIQILSYMPMVELVVILLLSFIGYFGFYIIRSHEQSVLWVGLAKETAHQLGTPISSLLGWIDFMKMKAESQQDAGKLLKILGEMESDISRLNRVATRFSQIGSTPELKRQQLNDIITFTSRYFQTRLPHLGKKINIELRLGQLPEIWFNRELIGWVIENLIRNAVDSIEVKDGLIIISTEYLSETDSVLISVSDNGKGIPRENLKQVFKPGFTTKKRGWGLGLPLCGRIVGEYHEGKIFVERTQRDVGTEFRIVLPNQPDRVTRNKHE